VKKVFDKNKRKITFEVVQEIGNKQVKKYIIVEGRMFYGEMIRDMLKDKHKPVNSMYLHEIGLKWNHVEEAIAAQKETPDNATIVEALNKFIKAISNKKFYFNPKTENGFKRDSDIFSTAYLDDLISILIHRTGIEHHKGIEWGKKSYTSSMGFLPANFASMEKNPQFTVSRSPENLQLIQNIDIQYRISGKRNFIKRVISLPMLTFHTCHCLEQSEFIDFDYQAKIAKSMLGTSRTYIITESLSADCMPELTNASIDGIFVLSKTIGASAPIVIETDVVDLLESYIKEAIFGSRDKSADVKIKGLLQ